MSREDVIISGIIATIIFLLCVFMIDTWIVFRDTVVRRCVIGICELPFLVAALHFREKLDFFPEKKRDVVLVIPAYGGLLLIGLVVSPILGVNEIREFISADFLSRIYLIVINFLCIAPAEEFYFRGILQKEYGIVLATVWFMILHPYNMWFQSAIASVILGYLRKKAGTLSATVVHGFYNATLIVLSFLI